MPNNELSSVVVKSSFWLGYFACLSCLIWFGAIRPLLTYLAILEILPI
jgi:hypothetical protein